MDFIYTLLILSLGEMLEYTLQEGLAVTLLGLLISDLGKDLLGDNPWDDGENNHKWKSSFFHVIYFLKNEMIKT